MATRSDRPVQRLEQDGRREQIRISRHGHSRHLLRRDAAPSGERGKQSAKLQNRNANMLAVRAATKAACQKQDNLTQDTYLICAWRTRQRLSFFLGGKLVQNHPHAEQESALGVILRPQIVLGAGAWPAGPNSRYLYDDPPGGRPNLGTGC